MKLQRAELRRATEEIIGIRTSLAAAYSCFNNTSDPELTEAYIYEINALRARYDYALRRLKQTASLL
ncbi:MAG: DUF2508 family protein [Oscillospiraceae bacterium]